MNFFRKILDPTVLTQREQEVVELIAQGFNNETIANRLFIDRKTVDSHVGNILSKMSANYDMKGRNPRSYLVYLYWQDYLKELVPS